MKPREMPNTRLAAEIGESKPGVRPPDDNRRPGELRRTTGVERQHRDSGNASTGPTLAAINREFKD